MLSIKQLKMIPLMLIIHVFTLIFSSLLMAQTSEPTEEFLKGARTIFNIKGHAKANGANFTIAYPNSWVASESEDDRLNIVQIFQSERGHGPVMMAILTNQLSITREQQTSEVRKTLFSPAGLKAKLPPNAQLLNAQSTEIEGEPAGFLEFITRSERAGMKKIIYFETLSFLSGNTLVFIQFGVDGDSASEQEVTHKIKMFKPLFTLMANSIVFPEKWTRVAKTSSSNQTTQQSSTTSQYDEDQTFLLKVSLSLVISTIIGLIIGLIPSSLIRYIFLKHPLSKKAASWISAVFTVFFLIFYTFLEISSKEISVNSTAIWVVAFFVCRWVLYHNDVLENPTAK